MFILLQWSGTKPTTFLKCVCIGEGGGASRVAQWIKNPPAMTGDLGSISWLGRSPGGRHDNPLQYSCRENPMDRGSWHIIVYGVTESDAAEHARMGDGGMCDGKRHGLFLSGKGNAVFSSVSILFVHSCFYL